MAYKSFNPLHNLSNSPAIMESIDIPPILAGLKDSSNKLPDVTIHTDFVSLQLESNINEDSGKSFLLIDHNEILKETTENGFLSRLGCDGDAKVKVVSIFGNTGDGKSHTLNHTFFNEEPMFRTSNEQDSCTLGVWAAYDRSSNVIVLDTEGLLGATSRENQRVRMLLKVLAISDVIIYRTRAERLHTDMYKFLASASLAYTRHFQTALASLSNKADYCGPLSLLGPAVLIFHETRNTSPLTTGINTPEDTLRSNFIRMKLNIDAFSSLLYIGIQTLEPPTNYSSFKKKLNSILTNTSARSPRSPIHVFNTLKLLNDKFSDALREKVQLFADEYFSCQVVCLSCGCRCSSSMGHAPPHSTKSKCRYQQQFENVTYLCRACHRQGRDVVVVPTVSESGNDDSWLSYNRYASFARYAWSGYSIVCPHCGEIYRSRQFWYGNQTPEQSQAVRTEIHHVWPGVKSDRQVALNSAQKVVDKVSDITDAISSVTAQPTKMFAQWAADQIAPKYWKPNDEIKVCVVCANTFGNEESKHHCRACGEGVCKKCSSNSRPVPERGWTYPVRVCDLCFTPRAPVIADGEVAEVTARKFGEAMVTGLSSVASCLEYPKSFIKASVRPGYWVPDEDARQCCVCSREFNAGGGAPCMTVHHCRDCGGTVCTKCSQGRAPVPHRGWPDPVRVCDKCLPTS